MTRARVAKGMSAEVCVSDTGLVQLSGNPRSDIKPPREHPQWESDVWDMFCDILHQNRSMSPQDEDMLLTDSN